MIKCQFCKYSCPGGKFPSWICDYQNFEETRQKNCEIAINTMMNYNSTRAGINKDKNMDEE